MNKILWVLMLVNAIGFVIGVITGETHQMMANGLIAIILQIELKGIKL